MSTTVPETGDGSTHYRPVGESLSVLERLIVAPTAGIFRRLDSQFVNPGDAVGIVESLRVSTTIRSPFQGSLVAFLAVEGERVRPGQPVAWLTSSSPTGTAWPARRQP